MYCMQCFFKSKYIKVELSMIKIGELLRKLWSLRSCFLILPPGALTPQGIEGAMKRVVSKHWCTLQWCASRGWFIAHENWTSCSVVVKVSDLRRTNSDSRKIVTIPGRTFGKNKVNRNWTKNIYFRSKHLVASHYEFSSTPILFSLYADDFNMLQNHRYGG